MTNSSPLSGFRTGETGAYGGEGGRMIAAISIGIIIIVAVIVAALAIIYFILKERLGSREHWASPRSTRMPG